MNFKRIEIVFVVVFFGLNLFLLFLYQNSRSDVARVTNSNQTEAIETLLSNNEIVFPEKFSDEQQEGYYLSGEQTDWYSDLAELRSALGDSSLFVRNTSISDDVLTNQISDRQLVTVNEVTEGIEAFLDKQNLVPFGEQYSYLEKLSNFSEEENTVLAGQSYEGIPFNDETSQIVMTLTEADEAYTIQEYTQTHLNNIEPLREKMELISEREAVTTLYTSNRLPNESEIIWTQLAYSRIMQVREKNVYVPVWFVALETSSSTLQIESVNAISNSVIATSSITRVAS